MEELLDGAPCGFVSFADDGTVLEVNATLLQMLESDRATVMGKPLGELFAAGARLFYQTHLVPLLKLQERVDEIYLVCRTSSGRDVPVLAYAATRTRAGVKVNECVLVPVGNRDRYERDIVAARQEAELALSIEYEAARARERLIGILGHDLRVPLTSITLGAEELVRTDGLDESGQITALAVLASARRAARMVADLLDFTRARLTGGIPIRRRNTDLREIARKIISEVGAAAPSRQIELVATGDCSGALDPDRMAQVLANLTRNAVEHGREDFPITVRLEGSDTTLSVHVENGCAREVERGLDLFSPWRHRDHPSGDGLGLGLFIVQQIVKAHGGEVSVTGAGGTFAVTAVLPRRNSDEPPHAVATHGVRTF